MMGGPLPQMGTVMEVDLLVQKWLKLANNPKVFSKPARRPFLFYIDPIFFFVINRSQTLEEFPTHRPFYVMKNGLSR